MKNRYGVTLIELLLTIIIGSIAFFALSVPFVTERSMWAAGKAQTEAQRDAQFALRRIARIARESDGFDIPVAGRVDFFNSVACAGQPTDTITFELHPGGELHEHHCDGTDTVLIDPLNTLSVVTAFVPIQITDDKLVQIQIDVLHNNRESESLITELFLRNG